jgi:hypothetical protein
MPFSFYRQAVDSQLPITPAYLDYIHRLFHDDRASGLVQVQIEEERQAVLFYHQGEVCFAYRQDDTRGEAIDPAQAGTGWQAVELPLRSLNLPPHALLSLLTDMLYFGAYLLLAFAGLSQYLLIRYGPAVRIEDY